MGQSAVCIVQRSFERLWRWRLTEASRVLGRPPTPELYPQIGTEYREEGAFAAGERDTGDAGVTEGIAQGRSEGTWGSCPRVDFRERLGGG